MTPSLVSRHVATLVNAERRIMLKGEDSQGRALSFKIVQAPRHGTLSEIRYPDNSVVYTPQDGFVGDDYFTYVARNNYMESNVAAVAIKIRDNDQLRQLAQDVEALLSEKSLNKAMLPALNLMGEAFTKQFAAAKERTGEYFYKNQVDLEGGKREGWFGGWFSGGQDQEGGNDETSFEEVRARARGANSVC